MDELYEKWYYHCPVVRPDPHVVHSEYLHQFSLKSYQTLPIHSTIHSTQITGVFFAVKCDSRKAKFQPVVTLAD